MQVNFLINRKLKKKKEEKLTESLLIAVQLVKSTIPTKMIGFSPSFQMKFHKKLIILFLLISPKKDNLFCFFLVFESMYLLNLWNLCQLNNKFKSLYWSENIIGTKKIFLFKKNKVCKSMNEADLFYFFNTK